MSSEWGDEFKGYSIVHSKIIAVFLNSINSSDKNIHLILNLCYISIENWIPSDISSVLGLDVAYMDLIIEELDN